MDDVTRILLIEDNPADADLIGEMLAEASGAAFVLERATRLSTGLERVAAGGIDLILLDLYLPDSRGLETFTRTHGRASWVPIVVLSGLEDETLAIQAVREGAQDYLPKDQVNGPLLVRAIQYAIERARAEEALRESEKRYRAIVENITDALYIHDFKGTILDVNERACEMLGYTRAELVDANLSKIDSEENTRLLPERMRRLLRKNAILFEGHHVRKDGDLVPVEVSAKVVTREGDGIIQGFVRDITERVRSEQEQAWTEAERDHLWKQVQEQAQRMRQIVDTVPEGVFLLDTGHRVALANPLGRKDLIALADAREGDILATLGGRPLAEFLTSPPKGLWHEVAAGSRSFQIIARPIENGSEPKGWVLVVRDVTQQREVERRIQQQERLAAVGQLAAGIAHDFNNIMAVITLYADISLRTPDLPTKLYERLSTIDEQARRASDLIQQLMDFSRRTVLERGPLDLLAFVKEQVKLLKRTLPEDIKISLSHGKDEYTVSADPTRIQQVIMNLATNARDAMPEGGELRLVLRRVRTDGGENAPLPEMVLQLPSGVETGDWICLTVADTGTGIPPDALPHIFDPFFTTKLPGQGTGLGLSQAYGIITQHEGHVDVSTTVGEGTTFTMYLPALPATQPELSARRTQHLPQGRGRIILVVEDEPATRKAVVSGLEMLGYRVLEAADGREALEIFEQHVSKIALVLSDMVMPNMGGRALFRALRRLDAASKIILMTGHPLEEGELEPLLAQGLEGWLPKPPSLERLARIVAQVLEGGSNGQRDQNLADRGQ